MSVQEGSELWRSVQKLAPLVGPLIAGGRYDGLLTRLGAREAIPAVGFAASIEELSACGGAA